MPLQGKIDPGALHHLPNLGPNIERYLRDVGIESSDDLRRIGAVRAFKRIRKANVSHQAARQLLARLMGAIEGKNWRLCAKKAARDIVNT